MKRLAEYLGHGLGAENIWAANGSNEVLQQILQAFGGPGRTALGFPPTYSMYPLLAERDGHGIHRRASGRTTTGSAPNRRPGRSGNSSPTSFSCARPNNPTGTGLGLDVVEAVYDAGEASQTIVIVDEAYHEFAHDGTPSALTLLPGRERLIVSRTMSKAFALAGARLGYMAAAPEVTDALRLVRLPYHLSAITQATALAALHHRVALMADVEDIKRQRDRIVTELQRMGLKPAASDSNYVFFGGLENPHEVWQGLLDAGVLIRDVGIPGHLRVTAGTETETTAFLEALERILTGQPSAAGLNWNQTHVTRAPLTPAPRHTLPSSKGHTHMSNTGSTAAEARTARMERPPASRPCWSRSTWTAPASRTSAPRFRSTTTC